MISVGIDVSKGKSTICAVRPYGEILLSPKDYSHTTTDLELLVSSIEKYDEEIHAWLDEHVTKVSNARTGLLYSNLMKESDKEIEIVIKEEIK